LIAFGTVFELNLEPMRRNLLISLILFGATFLLYWPTGTFEEVCFDDSFYTDCPAVRSGVNGHSLLWALTNADMSNWHPVTSLSFVLGHGLWGHNPGAEHQFNSILHALNAALLFLVLLAMTGAARAVPTRSTTWRCAVVAGLFAWHPFRVESVAWISERKDVLCGFFFLLTLLAYARYARRAEDGRWKMEDGGTQEKGLKSKEKGVRSKEDGGGKGWVKPMMSGYYWLALGFFALGLMSKAMLVTVPFLLLLLDVWPLRRIADCGLRIAELRKFLLSAPFKRLIMEKVPFLVLTLLFCVVTFWAQRVSQATPSLQELPLDLRLENVIASYLRYLGWTLWPANLAAFYSFPYDTTHPFYLALWPGWQIGAAILLLLVITILCVKQISRRPYLAVSWFWYLGMMVPVIGLVQVGSQGMADRYTYLPLIGPVIGVVWLVADWANNRLRQIVIATVAAVSLTACFWQTRQQISYWKNSDTLFRHCIEVTGENPRAEYLLGLAEENQGNIQAAMVHYRNAVSAMPRVKEAFAALGRLFGQAGRWTESAGAYAMLLGDSPDNFEGHLGMAMALVHLNREDEAEPHLKEALRLCPDSADALNNLAWTLATSPAAGLRDGQQAVKLARRACELTDYKETLMVGTLGAAYAEAGRFDEAITTAETACALASQRGEKSLYQINQQLLSLYRDHHTYRETDESVK
jgi:hypothetical protein